MRLTKKQGYYPRHRPRRTRRKRRKHRRGEDAAAVLQRADERSGRTFHLLRHAIKSAALEQEATI